MEFYFIFHFFFLRIFYSLNLASLALHSLYFMLLPSFDVLLSFWTCPYSSNIHLHQESIFNFLLIKVYTLFLWDFRHLLFSLGNQITLLTCLRAVLKAVGYKDESSHKSLIIKLLPTRSYSFKSKYITLTSFLRIKVLYPGHHGYRFTLKIELKMNSLCLPTCLIMWPLF